MENLHHFRKSYTKFELHKDSVDKSPFNQFSIWFKEALEDGTFEANAMIVSTVNNKNQPSSRVVLLKQLVEEGFIFFTNYESRKANEISENNNASILFFWEKLERQVRIEGTIEKVSDQISEDYFNARPRLSQIGAVISNQSKTLENRAILEDKFNKFDNESKIKRPENWGGYILKPKYFEFWQGRANRLHDRIVYSIQDNKWDIKRIYP